MAIPAPTNNWDAFDNSSVTSKTVTVSGAVAGRMLRMYGLVRGGGSVFSAPTGWTEVKSHYEGGERFYVAERVATGDSNDNFAASWTTAGRPNFLVVEWDDVDTTTPIVDSASSFFSSPGTTEGSGPVDPDTVGQMAVAVLLAQNRSTWATGNGFTGVGLTIPTGYTGYSANSGGSSRPYVAVTYKAITSVATETPEFTTTETSSQDSYLYTEILKESGGAGPTLPIFDHHYRMMR